MPLSSTSAYAIGIMLFTTIVAVYSAHLLINEVEIHHPSLYNDIGRPKLFVPRRLRDQCRFNLFILLRKYASVSNYKIRWLGEVIFLCISINLIIFIYLLCFKYNEFRSIVGP